VAEQRGEGHYVEHVVVKNPRKRDGVSRVEIPQIKGWDHETRNVFPCSLDSEDVFFYAAE
jgi:hypothetical protein